jgi:flavin-dependent dehydrogenase
MPAKAHEPQLENGSRIGVIGGGPAGSFFSYFLLQFAERVGLELKLDIYEPRDFTAPGPGGCNMCGGIVSESLVQALAAEGILLPPGVVQRSIDSYCLHMDVGNVRIDTPLSEKRIASVHRGGGPRGIREIKAGGLDEHLLQLARQAGAEVRRERVEGLDWEEGRPRIRTAAGGQRRYELLAAAVGVNSTALKLFEEFLPSYKPPASSRTYICEFCFGREMIKRELGSAMHVFLLNIPRLEFAALIPKGDYVTLCLLGQDIDKALVQQFLQAREVQETLPPNWAPPPDFCHCSPKISVGSAVRPYADRVVFVGDCGTTRLYKDGIGAAYRSSKAAARTAIFHGISGKDFERHYWPVCQKIRADNRIGRLVFAVTRMIQNTAFARRGLWRMVSEEQFHGRARRMSTVLWDTFTGSAPYGDVLVRTLHPAFLGRFAYQLMQGARRARGA